MLTATAWVKIKAKYLQQFHKLAITYYFVHLGAVGTSWEHNIDISLPLFTSLTETTYSHIQQLQRNIINHMELCFWPLGKWKSYATNSWVKSLSIPLLNTPLSSPASFWVIILCRFMTTSNAFHIILNFLNIPIITENSHTQVHPPSCLLILFQDV